MINDQQKDQSMFCIIRCVMLCSYLLAHCNVFPTFTTHPLCGTHPAWQSLSRIIHLSITKQYHCAVQIHYTLYNHNNHIYRTLFISLFPRKQLVFNTLIYQEHGAVDSSNRRNIITPCQNILLPSDYRHSKADGESEVASSLRPLNSCRYCHAIMRWQQGYLIIRADCETSRRFVASYNTYDYEGKSRVV